MISMDGLIILLCCSLILMLGAIRLRREQERRAEKMRRRVDRGFQTLTEICNHFKNSSAQNEKKGNAF